MFSLLLYFLGFNPSWACLDSLFYVSGVKKVENKGFVLSFRDSKCTYTLHDDDGFALLLSAYVSLSVPLQEQLENEHKKSKEATINLQEEVVISKEQKELFQESFALYLNMYNTAPKDIQDFLKSDKKVLEKHIHILRKGKPTRQTLGDMGKALYLMLGMYEYKMTNSCSEWTKEGKAFPLTALLPNLSYVMNTSLEKYNKDYPNFNIELFDWKECSWNPNNPKRVVVRGCNAVMDGKNLRFEKK